MAKAKKKTAAQLKAEKIANWGKEAAASQKKAGEKAAAKARKNPRKTATKIKAAKSKIKSPKATKTESAVGKGVEWLSKNIFETSGSKEYAANKKKKKKKG